MPNYTELSDRLTARMEQDKAAGTGPAMGVQEADALRRMDYPRDRATVWRPAFSRDVDKILHCPYYNRYNDKTQVFSLLKNDDVSRRGLHVQIVSRIARTIGAALNLNLDLIEAISLGHDLGHPPFGHTGERYLDALYHAKTGRHFCHNLQSVRVVDEIFPLNLTLQTLDGIACHNGEVEKPVYDPQPLSGFDQFDAYMEASCRDKVYGARIMPSTLEGAVMRVCDIIAYLGRDRQDANRLGLVDENTFENTGIGAINAEIIHNLEVNIIENSYGKPYIALDDKHFKALQAAKRDNYKMIYGGAAPYACLDQVVQPMMTEVYEKLLSDLLAGDRSSYIFTHHIDYVNQTHYTRRRPYEETEPNQLVVDYIASMTDDYFIDLHHRLFPDSPYRATYRDYFDETRDSHV